MRNGTHYLDITGETPFVAEVIERYHQECEERGIASYLLWFNGPVIQLYIWQRNAEGPR